MKERKNKSKLIITIIILTVAIIVTAIFIWNTYFNNKYSSNNYEAQRTSTQENNSSAEDKQTPPAEPSTETSPEPSPAPPPSSPSSTITEEILSTFSTKIYNPDSARQNNINITCQTLNGTTVANGATFSFCNTIGPSTTQKGYQKADIFDRTGKKKKGLGGGNCQISSTLYNAVLAVPNLNVTERHAHSNSVPYIQKGKDAAVAYGSYDFKFVNQTGTDIKITAATDSSSISTSIVKVIKN